MGAARPRRYPACDETRHTLVLKLAEYACSPLHSERKLLKKRESRSTVQVRRANEGIDPADTDHFASAFGTSLPLPHALDSGFEDALHHVLDNPGNLIRPKLVYQMAMAYGMNAAYAQDLAVALEYFHTASLLFDDLPCMDNALERRGAPCTHLVYGEEGAILAALALINRAYALAWRAVASCPREKQQPALEYIEQRLGVSGLLNGQSLDLHYGMLPHTGDTTKRIAMGKTVSLIRLTLVLPAMLGGAGKRELQQIERVSICWGLGYQIVDDLKDVLQGAAQTGKTPARDAFLGRPNIAVAIGIPHAVRRLSRLIDLGDRVMHGLLIARPELEFLERLRGKLEQELERVTRDCFAFAERERS